MTAPVLDCAQLTWFSPAGVEHPLSVLDFDVTGYFAAVGVAGLGAAPVEFSTDQMPRGGTTVRHVQPQARLITLPIFVEGADHTEFIARWRALVAAFTTTRRLGAGTLQVARPDGTVRLIDAWYQTGWDHDPEFPATADHAVLTLYCPDPFWRAAEATVITRTDAPGGVDYLSPYMTVSSSQTLGATVAANPGSIEAWPTWRLTGPASALTATNNTTGESFEIDIATFRGSDLLAGETVTITTEPPSLTGPDVGGSTNWTGALNWPDAILWGLDPGDNDVDFVVSGSGVGTVIEAEFFARYETA